MLGVCDGGVAYNKNTKFSSKENISCDTYKGDKKLSLNPSNKDDFEKMKIYYGSNGRIHSRDMRFKEELNSVLNLNTRRLIDARRKLIIDIINLMNKHKKMTKSQKLEWISNQKTPKDGLLPPFYDAAVKFIERFV